MSRATSLGAVSDRRTGVGGLLRASRLRCGEELDDIAQSLRIRRRHLLAIEEGEFEQLPGTTYAVGFIRAYADYLGLDSDEVVRRFKEEQAIDTGANPRARKSELVFPAPMAESGIPRGAVVFLGVVIGLIAYGGWYVSTVDNDFFKRWIEPVPARLAALLPGRAEGTGAAPDRTQAIAADRPSTAKEDAVKRDAVAEPAKPEAAAPAATPAPVETAALPAPQPQEAATLPAPAADAPAAAVEQPTPQEPATQQAAPAIAASTAQPAAEPSAPAPASQPAAPQPAAPDATAPQANAAPQQTTTEVAAATPKVEGAADARILVTAISDSWVEVREQASDAWVWGKLLRTGDSYGVPNRTDLKLKTGNAGGLTITVDGKQVPAVGATGEVVRNVALDPERLKAGTAVSR